MWIDDIIEKYPDFSTGPYFLRDAIFFKLPDDIITFEDINKNVEHIKDYCNSNNPKSQNLLNFDLSIPSYDNIVYYFHSANELNIYWLLSFNMDEYKNDVFNFYRLIPFRVIDNLVTPWVENHEINETYCIDFLQDKNNFYVNMNNIRLKNSKMVITPDNYTKMRQFVYVSTLLKINSLLNCINIIHIKNNHPEKLQKARIKRGKLPLQSYYTLELKGVSKKYENMMKKNDPQWANRIHLCRGHFKRYTEDKPLFGKYTGLWWWQPAVRGKNKKGVIFKDYELV